MTQEIVRHPGDDLKEGWIEGDTYIKSSWSPYRNLFSHGTQYLMIQAWDRIPLKVEWIELRDMAGGIRYRLSRKDMIEKGHPFVINQKGEVNWRVPTKEWEKLPLVG